MPGEVHLYLFLVIQLLRTNSSNSDNSRWAQRKKPKERETKYLGIGDLPKALPKWSQFPLPRHCFSFNLLDFPVSTPIFLQVFSFHHVIGWVIWHTGSEPQRLPRTEPTCQETPPGFQSQRMKRHREGKSRVPTLQVLTAYRDLKVQACICPQKNRCYKLHAIS